jgi:hypothetical protein
MSSDVGDVKQHSGTWRDCFYHAFIMLCMGICGVRWIIIIKLPDMWCSLDV